MKNLKLHLSLIILIFLAIPDAKSQLISNFEESEVIIENSVCKIYGTLMLPYTSNNEKIPVVLIIAGSGPTDRDGNNIQMKNNSLKFLAQELAKHNIASLRYDKRAVAKSEIENFNEEKLIFDDYVEDAKLWVNFLKRDSRFSEIIIAGHSEGSLIGMIAAEASTTDKYISLNGAGLPADSILKAQLYTNAPQYYAQSVTLIDSLKQGKLIKNYPPALYSLFRPSIQPYLISWMKYEPKTEIAKLKIPVLIIQGNTDIQMTTENAYLLSEAKPEATLKIIENMNHIFKESSIEYNANIATYYQPNLPVKAELVDIIVEFINTKQ